MSTFVGRVEALPAKDEPAPAEADGQRDGIADGQAAGAADGQAAGAADEQAAGAADEQAAGGAGAPWAEKTRAELVEEAEALGIKIPSRANRAQIQALIDDAPVI